MIYITGDTHGHLKHIQEFCELNQTTREDDIMIILGDAGINYYLDASDDRLKEKLSQLPITLWYTLDALLSQCEGQNPVDELFSETIGKAEI